MIEGGTLSTTTWASKAPVRGAETYKGRIRIEKCQPPPQSLTGLTHHCPNEAPIPFACLRQITEQHEGMGQTMNETVLTRVITVWLCFRKSFMKYQDSGHSTSW